MLAAVMMVPASAGGCGIMVSVIVLSFAVIGFNNRRLLEPLGNIPPAEAEANFNAALETEDMAA